MGFQTGEICLDILKTAWSPAWTLQSVCRAIIALMSHPEADSPLNCDCGEFPSKQNRPSYRKRDDLSLAAKQEAFQSLS
jgi:peroxin-4